MKLAKERLNSVQNGHHLSVMMPIFGTIAAGTIRADVVDLFATNP